MKLDRMSEILLGFLRLNYGFDLLMVWEIRERREIEKEGKRENI